MAGFAGSSGGGSSATATLGEMAAFHPSVGVPTGWLDTASAQVLLQATYPELYIEVGLLGNESLTGTWTENASPGAGSTLNAVAGNASNWVVVANSGDMFTCGADPSGTWTENTTAGSNTLLAVITDGTKWAATGSGTDLQTATDPTGTWTEQSALFGVQMYGGAYGNGYGVFIGTNGEIWTATDLTSTWTKNTDVPNITDDFKAVHYANNIWVAVGDSGTVWTCGADPTGTWTDNSGSGITGSHALKDVTWDGTQWVTCMTNISNLWSAVDPTGSWTYREDISQACNAIYADPLTGHTVALSTASAAQSTENAVSLWSSHTSLTTETQTFQGLGGFGRYVVAVGNDGTLWTRDLISYNTSTHFSLPVTNTTDTIMKVS